MLYIDNVMLKLVDSYISVCVCTLKKKIIRYVYCIYKKNKKSLNWAGRRGNASETDRRVCENESKCERIESEMIS